MVLKCGWRPGFQARPAGCLRWISAGCRRWVVDGRYFGAATVTSAGRSTRSLIR